MRKIDSLRVLVQHNKHLSQDERKMKYKKMAVSAFYFMRGSYELFCARCAGSWKDDPALVTWGAGDMHCANLGARLISEGEISYGLNDFDEGAVIDFRYDLLRLASSVILLAKENGLSMRQGRRAAGRLTEAYYARLQVLNKRPHLAMLPVTADHRAAAGPLRTWLMQHGKIDHVGAQRKKWLAAGKLRRIKGKLEDVPQSEFASVSDAVCRLVGLAVQDVARRIGAGTGSTGCDRYYALLQDGVILDIKEQGRAAAHLFLPDRAGTFHAARVITAAKCLEAEPEQYLRAVEIPIKGKAAKSFSVQRLNPAKESYPLLPADRKKGQGKLSLMRYRNLFAISRSWGITLADAHVRASRRDARLNCDFTAAALKACRSEGAFVREIVNLSNNLAKLTVSDFKKFLRSEERR